MVANAERANQWATVATFDPSHAQQSIESFQISPSVGGREWPPEPEIAANPLMFSFEFFLPGAHFPPQSSQNREEHHLGA